MKRSVATCGVVVMCSLVLSSRAEDSPKAEKTPGLPLCPVMGEPIDFAVKVAGEDGPVYFCCKRCMGKYKGDPKKYEAEVKKQRHMLASLTKIQATCPLTGDPINPKAFVDFSDRKIYACCKRCVRKLAANVGQYEDKIAASYTYQTKCPVSGEPINPTASVLLGGNDRVYFCCKRCVAAFKKGPSKYTANLESQGYRTLAKIAAK